jgi:hypothetical protein
MNKIAEELDAKLQTLDLQRAKILAEMVRAAMTAIDLEPPIDPMLGVQQGWPVGYFAQTAGALAGELFQRAEQGEVPERA